MKTNYYTFTLERSPSGQFWDLRLLDFINSKSIILSAGSTSMSGNTLYVQFSVNGRIVKTEKGYRFIEINSNWYGETKLCLTERKVKKLNENVF